MGFFAQKSDTTLPLIVFLATYFKSNSADKINHLDNLPLKAGFLKRYFNESILATTHIWIGKTMCRYFYTAQTSAKHYFSMGVYLVSSTSCASKLPTASPMTERYRSRGFPCCGGIRIGGWKRYSIMSSKAFWHSSFHVCGLFFLRSLKMGSQVEVSLVMNQLMYCSRPMKPLISFSL